MSIFNSPLKMLVGGCGMITSCSIWLFDGQNPSLPQSINLESSSSPDSIKLDRLTAVEKLSEWNGKAMEEKEFETSKSTDGTSSIILKFTKEGNKQVILRPVTIEVGDFYVYADSTKKQYQEFDRSEIKISLFKTPAWHSASNTEEYEAIDSKRVEELFDGVDEVRVKQLLLALTQKIEWLFLAPTPHNTFYMNRFDVMNLDDLKNLKIRHFNDFDRLKEYVKKKVATCQDDTKACYPHVDELDYLEMDKKEYFQNFK